MEDIVIGEFYDLGGLFRSTLAGDLCPPPPFGRMDRLESRSAARIGRSTYIALTQSLTASRLCFLPSFQLLGRSNAFSALRFHSEGG
jgi:hypothetical protein